MAFLLLQLDDVRSGEIVRNRLAELLPTEKVVRKIRMRRKSL